MRIIYRKSKHLRKQNTKPNTKLQVEKIRWQNRTFFSQSEMSKTVCLITRTGASTSTKSQKMVQCLITAINYTSKRWLPCPGIRDPESLTPASRLIIDSVRSPKRDPKKFRNPKAIALTSVKEDELNASQHKIFHFWTLSKSSKQTTWINFIWKRSRKQKEEKDSTSDTRRKRTSSFSNKLL